MRQLAAFLRRIDRDGVRVASSDFLSAEFGGGLESLFSPPAGGVEAGLYPSGWRHGREVIAYLNSKGAKVGKFVRENEGDQDDYEYDALRSDEELSSPGLPSDGTTYSSKEQDLEWVVSEEK